jgi:hypothetical protein
VEGRFRTTTAVIVRSGLLRFWCDPPLSREEGKTPNYEGQRLITGPSAFGISVRAGLLSGLRAREGKLMVLV